MPAAPGRYTAPTPILGDREPASFRGDGADRRTGLSGKRTLARSTARTAAQAARHGLAVPTRDGCLGIIG